MRVQTSIAESVMRYVENLEGGERSYLGNVEKANIEFFSDQSLNDDSKAYHKSRVRTEQNDREALYLP